MEITVLVKPVPEAEARLRARADGRLPDVEGVKFVLAGYDESAVEQALLLKETIGGSTVRAVAFGPARCEETLRAALALGCDRATWIESPSDGSETDPVLCGLALASVLTASPSTLVLAGKQAGDDEEGLVPSIVAERLGIPSFGSVVDLRPAAEGRAVRFLRTAGAVAQRWEVPLPCVVGLQQAWNDPRTAKLPNILKSRRAPIETVRWAELSPRLGEGAAPRSEPVRFELPAPRTGARLIEYTTPEEAAETLVRLLREEAKVFP
ncbi:MAG: electron transfer flavoprotein subunit beta/FixA family protein [Thermoplasmata archaeon]